ncbi:MAG: hypothetical protein QXR53_01785 [Candidatus Norongarragalinales archaeon]
MDQRTEYILSRYHSYLQNRRKPESFWGKFLRRTSIRAKGFFKQPVESAIYYTLSALPIPLWSEQDAAQVTEWFSRNALGSKSGFEAPHAPSEREESLLKSVAVKEFKRFLAQDPAAKLQLMQHYQERHGEVPKEIHAILPRAPVFRKPAGNSNLVHTLAAARREQSGRAVLRSPPRLKYAFK